MGPDLSLASEPARQVRWLARVGRPRARLGVRNPRRARLRIPLARSRRSAQGERSEARGSAPRDGDLRDEPGHGPPEPPLRTRSGTPWKKSNSRLTLLTCSEEPGHGPPEPPPRTRSGTPWKNQTPDLPCSPVPRLASPLQLSQGPSPRVPALPVRWFPTLLGGPGGAELVGKEAVERVRPVTYQTSRQLNA